MAGGANELVTPPRTAVVGASSLANVDLRLDARYYTGPQRQALSLVTGGSFETAKVDELADVWMPARFKRVYAADPSHGVPFLRAHSVFFRIPKSDRFLSTALTKDGENTKVERGWVLLARSGTIGAAAYATEQIAAFALTDDLLRIVPKDPDDGLYLYAYLLSNTGRLLATHDEHGSAVPHISEHQAGRVPVPILPTADRARVVDAMRSAVELREATTDALSQIQERYRELVGIPAFDDFAPSYLSPSVRTWDLESKAFRMRLDAEYYSRDHHEATCLARGSGVGVPLRELAKLHLPNRYKRYYVDQPHGTPILGGRHIHQWRPIGLKNIADRSFGDPAAYTLSSGMTVFPADGRVSEKLGDPAYVTSLWDGWKGSNHLMRAMPRTDTGKGLLFLGLHLYTSQIQIRARATGSVVDALTPDQIEDAVIPYPEGDEAQQLDRETVKAFEDLASALEYEDLAVRHFEQALDEAYLAP